VCSIRITKVNHLTLVAIVKSASQLEPLVIT
jgi:hypothetical protein